MRVYRGCVSRAGLPCFGVTPQLDSAAMTANFPEAFPQHLFFENLNKLLAGYSPYVPGKTVRAQFESADWGDITFGESVKDAEALPAAELAEMKLKLTVLETKTVPFVATGVLQMRFQDPDDNSDHAFEVGCVVKATADYYEYPMSGGAVIKCEILNQSIKLD